MFKKGKTYVDAGNADVFVSGRVLWGIYFFGWLKIELKTLQHPLQVPLEYSMVYWVNFYSLVVLLLIRLVADSWLVNGELHTKRRVIYKQC